MVILASMTSNYPWIFSGMNVRIQCLPAAYFIIYPLYSFFFVYWLFWLDFFLHSDSPYKFLHVLQVALKTLIVIHRTLREGDPTFREELLNFTQRARILQLSNFKDDSSPIGKIFEIFFYSFHSNDTLKV